MRYIKLVQRFFIGPKRWKVRRKIWGFCCGDIHPCYMWERKHFKAFDDAKQWLMQEPPMPSPRSKDGDIYILTVANDRDEGVETYATFNQAVVSAVTYKQQSYIVKLYKGRDITAEI